MELPGQVVLNVQGAGPKNAIECLKNELENGGEAPCVWEKRARLAAVLGSCPRSIDSLKSGVRHWIDFITVVKGSNRLAFPATIEDILAWSNMFRSPKRKKAMRRPLLHPT